MEVKKSIYEAVKEAGRYAVFTSVSAFITLMIKKISVLPQDHLVVFGLTLALRMIDKYLHEERKKIYKGEPNGLLPF